VRGALSPNRQQWAWLGIGLVVLLVRLPISLSPADPLESVFHPVSRDLRWGDQSVRYLATGETLPAYPLLKLNPAYHVAHHPFAWASFELDRALALATSILLVLGVWALLRQNGASPLWQAGAALVMAVTPVVVEYSARLYPPAMGAAVFLWGLVLLRRRPTLGAAALAVAAWIDPHVFLAVSLVFVRELWVGARQGQTRAWPLELTKRQTALAAAVLIGGALPVLMWRWSLTQPHHSPPLRWHGTSSWLELLGGSMLTSWLAPVLVAGLWQRRARWYCAAALTYMTGYQAVAAAGAAPEPWRWILPIALSVTGATLALDGWRVRRPRAATLSAAAYAILLVAGALVAPAAALAQPPSGAPPGPLPRVWADGRAHDRDLEAVLAQVRSGSWDSMLLVDVPWYHIVHPFHDAFDRGETWFLWSDRDVPRDAWPAAVEFPRRITVVATEPSESNRAFRDLHEHCWRLVTPRYVVLDGHACARADS
jgi:hypothetical protein